MQRYLCPVFFVLPQMSEGAIGSLANVGAKSVALLKNAAGLDAGSMNEKVTETLLAQSGAMEAVALTQGQEVLNKLHFDSDIDVLSPV